MHPMPRYCVRFRDNRYTPRVHKPGRRANKGKNMAISRQIA